MKNDNNDKRKFEPVGDIVSIFLRGKTWWANCQQEGKQIRKSLKTKSKKEARRRAILLEAEILQGRYAHNGKIVSIETAITKYDAYLVSKNRKKKTLTKYRKVFERVRNLASTMKRTGLREVDLTFTDRYRQERSALGRDPETIADELIIIRQIVNFALRRKLITTDPLEGIEIDEPKPKPQPCWTPAEVEQIIAAAKGHQAFVFRMLADTGMRIGELQWLTWADVDLDRNVLLIQPKEGWEPKTGDQRSIPMTPAVRALIAALPRNCNWVLPAPASRKYPKGDHQLSERRAWSNVKRIVEKLGLKGHPHTFRHSFISKALMAGIPEAMVRSWAGHVDRDIMDRYTHIADAQSQSAIQRLNEASSSSSESQGKGNQS